MPTIGQNNFLVRLIHEKTKVSKQEIIDILKVMPECMAEAFIQANLPAKRKLYIGGIGISWSTKQFGPAVGATTTKRFKQHLTKLKLEAKYPMAAHFLQKMRPINKKNAENKTKFGKNILKTDY